MNDRPHRTMAVDCRSPMILWASEQDAGAAERAGPGVDTLSLRLVTRAGIKGDLTILA